MQRFLNAHDQLLILPLRVPCLYLHVPLPKASLSPHTLLLFTPPTYYYLTVPVRVPGTCYKLCDGIVIPYPRRAVALTLL